jgi:hypothetical protein
VNSTFQCITQHLGLLILLTNVHLLQVLQQANTFPHLALLLEKVLKIALLVVSFFSSLTSLFVYSKPFQPSLLFASKAKAKAYLSEPFWRSPIGLAFYISANIRTGAKVRKLFAHNVRMFVISLSVCTCQAFPA